MPATIDSKISGEMKREAPVAPGVLMPAFEAGARVAEHQ
jgi:hypothetical protein